MAFTGTPVIKQITDRMVRITGVALAAGASGVVGLFQKSVAPDARCPQTFMPKDYPYDQAEVEFADSIDVTVKAAATGVATAIPVAVVKSGTLPTDFAATITNTHGSLATPNLEIYVRFHD